ncbi:hypothetical protein Hanom_Chr07g00651671 [Helianthus anomalus]
MPALEKEVHDGVEDGEIVMEEQSNKEEAVFQQLNMPEVHNQFFVEGSRSAISKNKRRKGVRKKLSPGRSPPNSDPERPKKRQRDGNDPFDIGRLGPMMLMR